MRNDFQYGRFKPIALRFLKISENIISEYVEIIKEREDDEEEEFE